MRVLKCIAGVFAVSAALTSCINVEDATEVACPLEVEFVLDGAAAAVRSSLATEEAAVRDVKIMAYSDGVLEAEGYFTSFDDMTIRLDLSKTYDLYALANMGNIVSPVNEYDIQGYVYRIKGLEDLEDTFPMCWSGSGFSPAQDEKVTVRLTRLVAKVTFDFNKGNTGLVVRSVRLLQSPLTVTPFSSSGSKAIEVADGDFASADDVAVLNKRGTVSFYMLENMQGTLLPGNTSPMNKVPSYLPGYADVCTYLEVVCGFASSDREGDVTYRMYLGEDNVTNFDVERNHIVSLSLDLTDDGLGIEDSWKVESDYVQHVTNISLDKTAVTMTVGEKVQLNATVIPDDADDKRVEWQSRNETVASVDASGVVTALEAGNAAIIVTSVDRPELYDRCIVTVVEPEITSLSFSPSSVTAVLGKDGSAKTSYFSVMAAYADGSTAEVTHMCSYSSSSSSAEVSSPGVVSHVSAGTAVITAELNGVKASMRAVTKDFDVCGVELQEPSAAVPLGESYALRFRVLYNDGSTSSWITYGLFSNGVFGAGGWAVADESVVRVDIYGLVTPVSVGQTTVTMTVYGREQAYTASAVIKVTAAKVVRVYVRVPAMFYDGSGGPALIGVFGDGTESRLKADKWTTSSPYVSYTEDDGLKISDESQLAEGVTLCRFTATYNGLSAGAVSTYGKWLRGLKVERHVLKGLSDYSYRLKAVMDDFTEQYVDFTCYASRDGVNWSEKISSGTEGITLNYVYKHIRFSTSVPYYDHAGTLAVWETEYHGY